MWLKLCILLIYSISNIAALNCTQIQDNQIYEGSEIHIPGGNGDLQSIPANFHCVYRITVPRDSAYKLYASVELKNGIRGVNDYIIVTEESGNRIRMNNRTGIGGNPYRHIVTPGSEMTIEVVTKSVFMNTKMAISVYYRAYCKQLPDSDVSDGQSISIPGNSLQPIPTLYSCTYLIAAPTSPTTGLYANVTLISNMNGFQDKIIVTDITGADDWDRDINYYNYIVIPGSSMSFQIKTGELFMGSMFLIRVEWHEVNIGPTKPMIRDEINYVDLALLKDDTSVFNSVTFSANEQLVVNDVTYNISAWIDFLNCFVIDGNITDQKRVFTFKNFNSFYFESESNYMTFVMFSKGTNAFVLNLLSVAREYNYPFATACGYQGVGTGLNSSEYSPGQKTAFEVINFESVGIKLTHLFIHSETCKAYIVSGSPSNSNILLDLSTAEVPHYFDVNNLSVVDENCDFSIFFAQSDSGVLELN